MNLKKHQYWAIIITLFFHAVLFWYLFFTEVNKSKEKEEYELELVPENNKAELEKQKEIERLADEQLKELFTNRPSKRQMRGEEIVEELTTKDLHEQFQTQKEVSITKASAKSSIALKQEDKKPLQTTEDNQEDEIKTVFYVGKSRVEYFLAERYRVKLPIPIYQCEGGGTVEVAISVNREGIVTEAELIKHRSQSSTKCMQEAAINAALSSTFGKRKAAPESQHGRIVYLFVPQK